MPAPYTVPSHAAEWQPPLLERIGLALAGIRDWLDAGGRLAWLAAVITGFALAGPAGFLLLGYVLFTRRMSRSGSARSMGPRRSCGSPSPGGPTGNGAFDAYRDETLRRLEAEHTEFMAFLEKLREAKDKSEFDQFMSQRGADAARPA